VKDEQCVWPMECAPVRMTSSSTVKFFLAKVLMSFSTSSTESGSSAMASSALETTLSRRPAGMDVAVAEDAGRVAASVDEDVGAGDDARAPVLDGGLDLFQEVEGSQADVHRCLLLRVRVLVGLVKEDRAVAALHVIEIQHISV
jgi:hypothetical protein